MAKIVVPFFDLMEFVVLRSLDLRELDVPCSAYPELLVSISDNPDGKSLHSGAAYSHVLCARCRR